MRAGLKELNHDFSKVKKQKKNLKEKEKALFP